MYKVDVLIISDESLNQFYLRDYNELIKLTAVFSIPVKTAIRTKS